MELSFDDQVHTDGWYVVTGEGDPDLDATYFELHSSRDNGVTWVPETGSSVRFNPHYKT
eukprot:CAMPEP_0196737050 /NCGR_PEP_ID=MMETSP1091-20130531/14903_1 /TAXON_ID=302021 /ORGANISM="Rhodomonas sp., Strain CCMP768" /LENGTH=58 /DNA_ID=CAMNT_0042080851 /DNA_START=73 /DNA_END=245 /DNA_ORIENTATION=+